MSPQTVSAKHSFLNAHLAFLEAGESSLAERVGGLGEVMFGTDQYRKVLDSLRTGLKAEGSAGLVKLEEARDHLIEAWKAFTAEDLDGKAARLHDFAVEIYGRENWALAVHRSIQNQEKPTNHAGGNPPASSTAAGAESATAEAQSDEQQAS